MKVTPVVAACITKGDMAFLGMRDISNHPDCQEEKLFGLLELPGGKLDNPKESFEEALVREVWEEYRLKINPIKVIHLRMNPYPSGEVYLVIYYLCELLEPYRIVTDTKRWVSLSKIEDLRDEWCLPGTKEVLRIVKEIVENEDNNR